MPGKSQTEQGLWVPVNSGLTMPPVNTVMTVTLGLSGGPLTQLRAVPITSARLSGSVPGEGSTAQTEPLALLCPVKSITLFGQQFLNV